VLQVLHVFLGDVKQMQTGVNTGDLTLLLHMFHFFLEKEEVLNQ